MSCFQAFGDIVEDFVSEGIADVVEAMGRGVRRKVVRGTNVDTE